MSDVDEAFRKIPRQIFLPEDVRAEAGLDTALPIGFGQTNSQPYTVRLMLRWLEVEPGNKVLDLGSGSGWTSGLLSELVGPKGRVYAVEKVPELVEFGRDNITKLGLGNVTFYQAGKDVGLPNHAPYDRILVSASAEQLPEELVRQLKVGGRMVIPVGQDILVIDKSTQNNSETTIHPGFLFVPLVK